MKTLFVCIALIGLTIKGVSQPSVISFTNKAGAAFNNVSVISYNDTEVFYELPGGGGRVKLSELPGWMQKDFHYDSVKAAAKEREVAEKKATIGERVFAQTLDSADKIAAAREEAAVKRTGVKIAGEVFQICYGGVLIRYGLYYEQIGDTGYPRYASMGFVEDCDRSKLADEQAFATTFLYPVGTYRYDTAAGSYKTVKKYTVSLAAAIAWRRMNSALVSQ